jgi:hypothetical protein
VRLVDPWFEAEFIGGITEAGSFHRLPSIDGAQAVFFYGPCGYGETDGTHAVIVPFANPRNAPPVPAGFVPKYRWQMSGSALHDLSLSPSVNCAVGPGSPEHNLKPGECRPGRQCWHGFITNGEVR